MELGKYIKAKRSMLRRKGGLNTVIPARYDVGDPNFDYRVGEQSYAGGGAVKKIIKRILSPDDLRQLGKKEGIPKEDIEKFLSGEYGLLKRAQARGVVQRDKEGNIFVKDTYSKKYDPIRKQMKKEMFDKMMGEYELEEFKKSGRKPNADGGVVQREDFVKGGSPSKTQRERVALEKKEVAKKINKIFNEIKTGKRPLYDITRTKNKEFFDTDLSAKRFFAMNEKTNAPHYLTKTNFKTYVNKILPKMQVVRGRTGSLQKNENITEVFKNVTVNNFDEIVQKFPSQMKTGIYDIPKNAGEHLIGSLKRHVDAGGKQFKLLRGNDYKDMVFKDKKTGKVVSADIVNNDLNNPRWKNYTDTYNEVKKINYETPFTDPITGKQTNAADAYRKLTNTSMGVPVELDHFGESGVYGDPISNVGASSRTANVGANITSPEEATEFFGRKQVDVKGNQQRFVKFLERELKRKAVEGDAYVFKTPKQVIESKKIGPELGPQKVDINVKPGKGFSNIDTIAKDLKKIKPQDAVNAISNLACKDKYTDGGRVKFKKGSNCFLKGAEIIQDAKAGNPSALQKVRKYLKTPAAKVGLGALVELGLEGLFAVESIAEGKPFDQVLGESLFGLVGFGSTEEEQILKHANPKDIENVKAYQKKLANEGKLDANVAFEETVQPETGEESTEDFFTVESLRPAMDKQRKQLQKDFLDPNLDREEEAYGRAYRNYLEANKKRAEEQGYRKPFQYIKEEIYDPTGKKIMEAYEGIKDLFAEGGRVGMSEGGDPKDKMKTPFDKPTLPLDPNQIPQVENPSRRGFIKGAGFIGAGIAAFAAGLLRLGQKESAKKLVQKAATYGGRRIDGVPEIISDLIQTIKLKGQVIDAPKPGSGPVVYKYNKYEYVEDINGFTINKINDRGDYGYSEEVFQFEKDPETGAVFFDDITVKPDGDGKLKDVEYGVDTETYDEIADDLAKFNHNHPNDTRFRDKAKKWVDEERLRNEGIEPKPGTELD